MPEPARRSRVFNIGPLLLTQISRIDFLISRRRRSAMRLSRWPPVCPECGYSLRGLTQPRCPECGVDLPASVRTFRRWAIRRIPWDRLQRGSFIWSYLRTVAVLIVNPVRGARALIVPDRWGRCIRWATAHVGLAAVAAAILGNHRQYLSWARNRIRPPVYRSPQIFNFADVSPEQILAWIGQSFCAWSIVLLLPVLIGCAISYGLPGRHPAAKLGGVKWSLFLTPIFLLSLAASFAWVYAFPDVSIYRLHRRFLHHHIE